MRGFVLYGNRAAEVIDVPVPEPGPGQLRIKIKTAGICGSDLHFYNDTPEGLGIRRGVVIGHEPSGVVDTIGAGVAGFSIGDRVTVNHTLGCGLCEFCMEGATVLCDDFIGMAAAGYGGDAEYVVMPASSCYKLPDYLSYTDGSFLACTGATAFGALEKLALHGGKTLVVFGLGPVGLSGVLLGKAMGARVIGVDVNRNRLEFAEKAGCDKVINAAADAERQPGTQSSTYTGGQTGKNEVIARVKELTGGRGADYSFETSGSPPAQSNAVDILAPRGGAVFVGINTAKKSINPEQFIHKEITLFGSKVLPISRLPALSRLMEEKDIHFDAIVSNRIPLEEAPEAFSRFNNGTPGKFIIEF